MMSLGGLLTGLSAFIAATTWKKQIKYKKRYVAAEKIKKCFLDYVHYFYNYYYMVLKELRKNNQALCENELVLEEREILDKKYLSYLYAWEEMEYYLKEKEIKKFIYKPKYLQTELLEMLPSKNSGIDEDGYYKLPDMGKHTIKFENEMSKIRKDGLFKVKSFRE